MPESLQSTRTSIDAISGKVKPDSDESAPKVSQLLIFECSIVVGEPEKGCVERKQAACVIRVYQIQSQTINELCSEPQPRKTLILPSTYRITAPSTPCPSRPQDL